MSAKIVDGKHVASRIYDKVKSVVEKYDDMPSITTIKIGKDPSSELYLRLRDKACNRVGIASSHEFFTDDVTEREVLDKIQMLNNDSEVHGILVQLPLPVKHISSKKIINAIDPKKDVEGLHPFNMGKTMIGDEFLVPCTPLAVLKILEYENVDLKGLDVAVVNHSEIVGKPLTALFLNRNATVSVSHVFTKNLSGFTKNADVLVSAAGVADLIKKDMVKPGSFVIDVGIIPTKDGVTGDVEKCVADIAGKITPVPGGVGPVTVACSLLNMIKTFKNCINEV